MSTTVKKKNAVSYIHVVIMFVIMFGVSMIPPFGQITEIGMRVLGVFLGLIYGWIFVDFLWTSLFGYIALGLTGYTTITAALSAGFGNASTLLVMITIAFAEVLNNVGVNSAIAYWLLSKKIFVGRPWLLIFGISSAAILMGVAGGGLAAIFLLWGVITTMAEINGYERKNRLISMLLAIVLYAVMSGAAVVPFQGAVILYGGWFTQGTGLTLPSAPFFGVGLIYVFATMFLIIIFSKVFLKVDASNFNINEDLRRQYAEMPVNKYQKVGLILLLVYFLGLLLPEIIPDAPLMGFCKELGVVGFSSIYMFVFAIWKNEEGKSVADIAGAFTRGISWPVMMLMSVTFPLAEALESADVGVMATISEVCLPFLSSLGVTGLIILTTVVLAVITQFMHNIVMGALFIPFITPLVVQMGGNPYTCFFMMYLALCCAYATPAGSWMAGMLFGNEDVPTKNSYLFGWMFTIISLIILICLMPICNLVLVK